MNGWTQRHFGGIARRASASAGLASVSASRVRVPNGAPADHAFRQAAPAAALPRAAVAPAASLAPIAPITPAAAANRDATIVGSAEAVGRERLAEHLAGDASVSLSAALGILAASHRSPAISAALAGAGGARLANGLPADTARDAAAARAIDATIAVGLWRAPADAASSGSDADEFAAGAEAARKLIGRR